MRRGYSPAAIAAFLTTLLVLAVVGWSIGWLAAGTDLAGQQTPVSSSPSNRPAARATTSSPSPSVSPTAFGMPKLVGMKFREARQKAFDLKLGVTIRFNESGAYPAGTVAKTSPADGVLVKAGLTIILYVTGAPPKVTVPDIAGKTCNEGKDLLLEAGLLIKEYPTGDKGRVVKTEPSALTELKWNDQVQVYCSGSASP